MSARSQDWPRARGAPLIAARIRCRPADFQVSEDLGFEADGDGEHDLLHVEKRAANTAWVARQLARHAGVRFADVGFSGLKDRNAVSRQWFSVPRRSDRNAWSRFECDGVEILHCARHRRKLRRGSHRRNRFRIVLRGEFGSDVGPVVEQRLQSIADRGVPNYFGEQRFGRNGANLDLAERLFAGERLRRDKRGIAISAARSFLFNEILAARVENGTWDRILPGELVNLDGSGSVFMATDVDAELERRCAEMDIHPTASLYGVGGAAPRSEVARLESQALEHHGALVTGLEQLGAKRARRSLRLKVADLDWRFEPGTLRVGFTLARGGFATTVLGELAEIQAERNST